MFADAFSRVPQLVIWKQRGKVPESVPSNVKLMKWIPQNDLLGRHFDFAFKFSTQIFQSS